MKFTFEPESRPLDGYTIKRAIYRGGFGEVYYALTDVGREVALKLLQNNTEVELRGVQQCLNLSHPNLVTIFDVKTDDDGDHWIIMEYVAGETLDAAIHRHPEGMPLETVRQWMKGMSDGVGYLHQRGIVHRDLKPGNVFSDGGVVKIGDVGLSKFITPSRRSAQTQSVGTVYYMAPEVAKGRYGMEVDVYALGIILYEMLTGRVPFEGESTGEILMKHLSERPDLEKLPPRLRPVIGKALEKDPTERFATVPELHEAFEQAAIGKYKPPADSAVRDEAKVAPATAADEGWWRDEPQSRARRHAQNVHTQTYHRPDDVSPWRPTRRAMWLMLAAGPVLPVIAGERGDEALALAIVSSWVVYLLYGLSRSKGWATTSSFVNWLDADSRPVGAWHWAGLAAFLCFITAPLVNQGGDDVLEVGIPISLGMGLIGMVLAHVLPSGSAVKQWKREVNEEATKIRSVAAELERAIPQPPPAAPKRRYVAPEEAQVRYYRHCAVDPTIPRKIDWRTRLTQFVSAATMTVPIVLLLSLAAAFFSPQLFALGGAGTTVNLAGVPFSPALLGLFTLTAIGASWVLLALSKVSEGRPLENGSRRLAQLGGGLVVGLMAIGLAEFLLIPGAIESAGSGPGYFQLEQDDALFVSLGDVPLVHRGGTPSRTGFLVFFAALFALRRWWWHADTFRPKRFRISSVLLTVLMAWLVSEIWAFPQLWAMTWAAVISSSVQLASSWTPEEQRRIVRETSA